MPQDVDVLGCCVQAPSCLGLLQGFCSTVEGSVAADRHSTNPTSKTKVTTYAYWRFVTPRATDMKLPAFQQAGPDTRQGCWKSESKLVSTCLAACASAGETRRTVIVFFFGEHPPP